MTTKILFTEENNPQDASSYCIKVKHMQSHSLASVYIKNAKNSKGKKSALTVQDNIFVQNLLRKHLYSHFQHMLSLSTDLFGFESVLVGLSIFNCVFDK